MTCAALRMMKSRGIIYAFGSHAMVSLEDLKINATREFGISQKIIIDLELSCLRICIGANNPPRIRHRFMEKKPNRHFWVFLIPIAIFVPWVSGFTPPFSNFNAGAIALYGAIEFNDTPPPYDVFQRAFVGYSKLKNADLLSNKEILTIIDFRLSANQKRLWVIDLKNKILLFHSLTAHGKNSGEVFANSFSNTPNSNQSSLGFYVTGNTYIGKHGISLKLHGVESGINDKAEIRAIVMHGANYVSESYITKFGRLGRSFGCPAVPVELHKQIIASVANKTCLFIYYPDRNYIANTQFKNTVDEL
jgi:hypothetical protein